MKALFIGGTGTISSAITRAAVKSGWELFHLNRGNRKDEFDGVTRIQCDIRSEEESSIRKKLEAALGKDKQFDVVADFIAFVPDHVKKDFNIFNGLCAQFFFISSASAYQKPLSSCLITESTPLSNPLWQYSRDKIACEEFLMDKYREHGFPVTIIRPSHTYDERSVPIGVHGKNGSWQTLKRMLVGKPVIIHGDGTSLWTVTHNSDFALAFIGLMGNIHAIGEAVQITSDESVTWNQIYQIIADALKVELKAVHIASDFLDECSSYDFKGSLLGDKANSVIFDNTKLKRLVPGFYAKTRADEGLKMTIANVLKNPELQKEDPEFDEWCDNVIAAVKTAGAKLA
jgi:nucleoside-diphosphate-sugar epimerase